MRHWYHRSYFALICAVAIALSMLLFTCFLESQRSKVDLDATFNLLDGHLLHLLAGANKTIPQGWQYQWASSCSPQLSKLSAFPQPTSPKATSIVFLKTHKTAGSTIFNILLRFGDTNHLTFALPPYGHHMLRSRDLPARGKLRFRKVSDIFCLHTDFKPSEIASITPKGAIWFTAARDPDRLFESSFKFFELHKVYNTSFEEFLNHPPDEFQRIIRTNYPLPLGSNQMIRDLGLDPQLLVNNPEEVNKYIDSLQKLYSFVIINEYMDESLILLRHLLGWGLVDILSLEVNRRSKKTKNPLATLTKNQLETLREINAGDHLLHKAFLAQFRKRLGAFGSERMEAELKAFRCLQDAIKNACGFRAFPPRVLPCEYRPHWISKGFYPAGLRTTTPPELHWMCPRLAYPELQYVEHMRIKQRINSGVNETIR